MKLDEDQKQLVRATGYPVVQETERDDEEGYIDYYVLVGPEVNRHTVWTTRVEFGRRPSYRAGGRAFVDAQLEQAECVRLCVAILGGGRR